jgi:hypothetical protein
MNDKFTGKVIIGGIFFLANSLLIGCDQGDDNLSQGKTRFYADDIGDNVMAQRQSGVMTMVEEIAPDNFRIVKEYPSQMTGIVVKHLNGSQEVIPDEKVPAIMEQAESEKGMGLGSVLSAGLLGYMMGRNSSISPIVYKDDNLYRQSLLNRELIYKQQEEEDKRKGYTGYWSGGRYYSPSHYSDKDRIGRSTGSAKSGFFSRLARGFRGLG